MEYLLNNLGEVGGCAGGYATCTPPLIIEMILIGKENARQCGKCLDTLKCLESGLEILYNRGE